MLHQPPTATTPDATTPDAAARAAPRGSGPAVAVLLLSAPSVADAVQELLHTGAVRARVSRTASLGDALVAVAGDPPALAVVDGELCGALERDFVDHLLRSHAETRVLLVGSDAAEPWPHPRLTRVPPHAVLPAVTRWLVSAGRVEGTAP